MEANQEKRFDFITQELKTVVEQIPEIRFVGLVSVDGLMIDFYSRNSHVEEDRLTTMVAKAHGSKAELNEETRLARIEALSAAMVSLSERITYELGGKELVNSVITGKNARIFEVLINEDAVLTAVLDPVSSMDMVMVQLQAAGERILAHGFDYRALEKAARKQI